LKKDIQNNLLKFMYKNLLKSVKFLYSIT